MSKKLGMARKQKSIDDAQLQSNKELQKVAELQKNIEFKNEKVIICLKYFNFDWSSFLRDSKNSIAN